MHTDDTEDRTDSNRLISKGFYSSANPQPNTKNKERPSQTVAKTSLTSYSLANVILVSKLLIVEAELVNKIGRHLLHLIIRKGLATPGPTTVI